jgi:predicted glutamine amidotransferase
MCRIVAYQGDAIPLSQLTNAEPGGLIHRALKCEQMPGGTMCPDGWKLGWFLDDCDENAWPVIMTGTKPAYMDENLRNVPRGIWTGAAVGVVRLATLSTTIADVSNPVYDFPEGIVGYNCSFEPWPDMMPAWRKLMSPHYESTIKDHTEPEHFTAIWRERLDRSRSADREVASLKSTLGMVAKQVVAAGGTASLSLVLVQRDRLVACRWALDKPQNSLYWALCADGVWVASEPVFESHGTEWVEVERQSIVSIGVDGKEKVVSLES